MLISAKVIKKPRKKRKCVECGLIIEGPTLRLYGAADRWDPPGTIYLHIKCEQWPDPKITKALGATA